MVIMMMINSSPCDKAKGAALNQRGREEMNVVGGEEIGAKSQRKRPDRKSSQAITRNRREDSRGDGSWGSLVPSQYFWLLAIFAV